ncbi:MAG: exonuclease SbcCD subunit D [Clostridia bacterium]|nr:exonuclease SbcCD subunit D [Clostridia bacterium]
MKLLHLSDLHIGKTVNRFSMLEDQEFILAQILQLIDREAPDAVLIAGDVYDKTVPSAEAVQVLDDFLFHLSVRRVPVLIVSGNHDSPERIAFGARQFGAVGLHLSPVYHGQVTPVTLRDAAGPVNFYLLPFVKPAHVRAAFPEAEIGTYTDAVRTAIDHMAVDPAARNVLITHQFVTGAARAGSEELSVGGTDAVDASVFAAFDYVALGHIHGAQRCGSDRVRYCGAPLKYAFSEANSVKSVTLIELGEKGQLQVRTEPLKPKREMVCLRGSFDELMMRSFYADTTLQEDYVQITLTDEGFLPNAIGHLRTVYHNLMELTYDNTRTRTDSRVDTAEQVGQKSELELFSELFELQNGRPMSEEQQAYVTAMLQRLKEGSV